MKGSMFYSIAMPTRLARPTAAYEITAREALLELELVVAEEVEVPVPVLVLLPSLAVVVADVEEPSLLRTTSK